LFFPDQLVVPNEKDYREEVIEESVLAQPKLEASSAPDTSAAGTKSVNRMSGAGAQACKSIFQHRCCKQAISLTTAS